MLPINDQHNLLPLPPSKAIVMDTGLGGHWSLFKARFRRRSFYYRKQININDARNPSHNCTDVNLVKLLVCKFSRVNSKGFYFSRQTRSHFP